MGNCARRDAQIYDGGRKLACCGCRPARRRNAQPLALPVLHAHAAPTAWSPVTPPASHDGRSFVLAGPGGSGNPRPKRWPVPPPAGLCGDDFVMVEPLARRVQPIYASARLRPERWISWAISPHRGRDHARLRRAAARVAAGAGFATPIRGGEIAGILPRRTGKTVHHSPGAAGRDLVRRSASPSSSCRL